MIFIGLGANLGKREMAICDALLCLEAHPAISIEKYSSFYQTAPVGKTNQPDFINAAAQIASSLSPLALLDVCLEIEAKLGRVRRERWGPRAIDIDLLSYHNLAVRLEERLELPHPRMTERRFVLTPLAEIAAEVQVGAKTIGQWLEGCPDSSRVLRCAEQSEVGKWLKEAHATCGCCL